MSENNKVDLKKAFAAQLKKVFALAQMSAAEAEFQAKDLQSQSSRAGLETAAQGWINRTNQALNAIQSYVERDKDAIVWGLMTTVEYGKWLEIANDRKYELMRPIVFGKAQEFIDEVNEIL